MIDESGLPASPRPRNSGSSPSSLFQLLLALLSGLLPVGTGHAQFEYYGLRGHAVYGVAPWGGRLYAATDNGIYVRPHGGTDTNWTLVGLKGKTARAVYPHPFGPIGYAVTAGVQRTPGGTDSTVLFCSRYSDTAWVAADTGINRTEVSGIRSIHGFFSSAICGETYAGGNGKVFMRAGDSWQKVFDIGIGAVNVVKAHEANTTVWIGGETAIFAPYIAHSHDKGKTWTTTFPNLAGDNACNALAFDPSDTTVLYAGMEGVVIKSTDSGHQWFRTGLTGTPFYMYALVFDNLTHTLFAGGTTSSGLPGLYATKDGGARWSSVQLSATVDGIVCMILVPTAIPELNFLVMGTLSSGVVAYRIPFTSVRSEPLPEEYQLSQNYPNPFNPNTTIEYAVGRDHNDEPIPVGLVVYDALGREVKSLVRAVVQSGTHAATWDGADENGRPVASGVYLCRLWTPRWVTTRMMLLLR